MSWNIFISEPLQSVFCGANILASIATLRDRYARVITSREAIAEIEKTVVVETE